MDNVIVKNYGSWLNEILKKPRAIISYGPIVEDEYEYRGFHKAPSSDYGAPMYDMTKMYPNDFYDSKEKTARYYGDGTNYQNDLLCVSTIFSVRNKPDAMVKIYRAVPNIESANIINPNDWVTIQKRYAIEHGESWLHGKYIIVSKTVPARTLYTEGNSIYEWGYNP